MEDFSSILKVLPQNVSLSDFRFRFQVVQNLLLQVFLLSLLDAVDNARSLHASTYIKNNAQNFESLSKIKIYFMDFYFSQYLKMDRNIVKFYLNFFSYFLKILIVEILSEIL